MCVPKRFSDRSPRLLFVLIPPLSLLVFFFLSTITGGPLSAFSSLTSYLHFISGADVAGPTGGMSKEELGMARIAVCLVGGARRFDLTGPSILQNVLWAFPNADLFLHSPLDRNSFKFSILSSAPRIASVRIFEPKPLPETDSQIRVLAAANSPNGLQGLLQYFNLVEGCLTMIVDYQNRNNFTYDWVIRTRVDGYWGAPLSPSSFVRSQYSVPSGSAYGGLNDRLGVGDFNTSIVALSRVSLIPKLDAIGLRQLNSEAAFKGQLTSHNVPFAVHKFPFCILSDRKYPFPPVHSGVPVAALSSRGPLSGAKCRPCTPACQGSCVRSVMSSLDRRWSWTDWEGGNVKLCDARDPWELGWEKVFDGVAGTHVAATRKRVRDMNFHQCVRDFLGMKRKSLLWDTPPVENICGLALVETTIQ